MKIYSWNINGLRSGRKEFLGWLKKSKPDIVCLQEVKAQEQSLPKKLKSPKNYRGYFNFAIKPGYSGVAVYAKKKPLKINNKLGLKRFDAEGRLLHLEYSNFILINIYLPHGGRDKGNLGYKLEVYKKLISYLKKIKHKKVILIGDFNIAHTELDLARPKDNKKNIMFTPEERRQLDKIIALGFTDTFRKFYKTGGHYTWWPYRLNARARDLGWRIDYIFTAKPLTPKLKNALILKNIKGSDHCPIGIELK